MESSFLFKFKGSGNICPKTSLVCRYGSAAVSYTHLDVYKRQEQGLLLSIKNLMETMGWSVEQAMEGLKIPKEEKSKYLDELKKCKGRKHINFENRDE